MKIDSFAVKFQQISFKNVNKQKQQKRLEMVKKSQLRKYNLQKIMELISSEVNGESLKVYNEFIQDKNKILLEKKDSLLKDLQSIRKRIEINIKEMNDGIKDRMQLKRKNIMGKESRPCNEDVKELTDLFVYMEKQNEIINRNCRDIKEYGDALAAKNEQFSKKTNKRVQTDYLDEQYFQLHEQCQKQLKVRDRLIQERQSKRKHYACIASSIEQCRVQYQIIESKIAQKERQLIQLSSYFQTRKNEDDNALDQLNRQTMQFESQLLQAQVVLNYNNDRRQVLQIQNQQANHRQL